MKRIWIASSVVCGAVLLLVASQPPPEAVASPMTAPAGPPTLAELKNATYSGLEEPASPVTLKDGIWEGEPFQPGGTSRPRVSLGGDFHLLGDLDGDGAEEAVVVLAQSSGGSGTFDYFAVVKRKDHGLENVATTALGDRVQLRAARIENGKLVVSGVRAGEEDARCCPGELVEWEWVLQGGTLIASAAPRKTGRLSLDALAGTEWVLRGWGFNDPAPAEPEVTLTYQDGRFAGTSGCNRYFGSAKAGEMPGDLAVGPTAGTRMACPEPQSAVEARFLKQLGGAQKFGFLLGQLAVSYQTEGGVWGTMLFEGRPPARAAKP
jgi:heat shock protein HslJ